MAPWSVFIYLFKKGQDSDKMIQNEAERQGWTDHGQRQEMGLGAFGMFWCGGSCHGALGGVAAAAGEGRAGGEGA